jgi:hypothetical protein
VVPDVSRGESANPCTAFDRDDGKATIFCGDGTIAVVSGESIDAPSTSCDVSEDGSGGFIIACEDGTSVIVALDKSNGSCSVTDNGDGTATLACEDGTPVTWPSA